MGSLTFIYGAMNSAKTLNLLAVNHSYRSLGKRVVTIKPAVDTRTGNMIRTRVGLEAPADIVVGFNEHLVVPYCMDLVLVDEAQFLSQWQVEYLRAIANGRVTGEDTKVMCYGLKTAFDGTLFPGSKRLIELADHLEEIDSVCSHCHRGKAIFNMRMAKGRMVISGDQVQIGDQEYHPVCAKCYEIELRWVL